MYIKVVEQPSKQVFEMSEFTNKEVILFGAATYGQKVVDEFEQIGAKVLFFCDNNKNLFGKEIYNYDETSTKKYEVRNPKEILNYPKALVIITSTYFEEVSRQLEEMGLRIFYLAKMGVHRDTIELSSFRNTFIDSKDANELICEKIFSNKPFFIGRLGSVELETICHYKYFEKRFDNSNHHYPRNVITSLVMNAGFFPPEEKLVDKFVDIYLTDISKLDLIWSMWHSKYEDLLYTEYSKDIKIADYEASCFPVQNEKSWLKALKGKKVLVIHPFEESIRRNYLLKDKLFSKQDALPDFELYTLKAVQSIAGTKTEFCTWFDALEYMKKQIDQMDFEIALVGAGGYGFPLGAYIKDIGKKAIHIGGTLQLFFGIKGKFYDKLNIYNEFWTQPLESERPTSYLKVESGRYW